jgi:uncharacterized membrane protein
METGRLETFADGVFAIAATLLILNVDASCETPCDLRAQVLHAWPSYAAYAASFVTMGIIWANHHSVMNQIGRANRTFLMLTVLFLMVVAFVPFPTRLVADHIGDPIVANQRTAVVVYGITFTLTAVMFNVLWFYAIRRGQLLRADADPRVVRGISRTFVLGPWTYVALTLVALISPKLGAIGFLLFALFWVIESAVFGRDAAAQAIER